MPTELPAPRTRILGRTGLVLSEVSLGGAWLLGPTHDLPDENATATVARALELGVNFLDTSECYLAGRSEELIAAALAPGTARPVLGTKCGHRPRDFDWSRASVVRSAAESLHSLGRDSVELYQLHTHEAHGLPLERIFGSDGALEGLREVRERGWCDFLGITGQNLEFLVRCVESDAFDTVLLHGRYDLLDQSGLPLLEAAHARGVGVILGSPLRMGLFGVRRNQVLGTYSDDVRRRVLAVEEVLAGHGVSTAIGAIAFVLARPEIGTVLCGASSPDQITEAVAASAVRLPGAVIDAITDIATG